MPNETTDKPPHPLVVDEVTKLCRYATQADIQRMEAICNAFYRCVQNARLTVELSDELKVWLDRTSSDG